MPLSPAHVGLHGAKLARVREATELMDAKILCWKNSSRQISSLITPSTKLSSSEELVFARLYLSAGWEGVALYAPSPDSRLSKGPSSVIVTLFRHASDCAVLRKVHTQASMLALETPAHQRVH